MRSGRLRAGLPDGDSDGKCKGERKMRMSSSSKRFPLSKAIAGMAVASAFVLVGSLAVNGVDAQSATADEGQTAQSEATWSQWKSAYPEEYGSFATDKWRDGVNHSHYSLRSAVENYDPTNASYLASCISCKSTAYNDLYAQYGDALFDMGADALLGDAVEAYWDCEMCHTSVDDLTLQASIGYYQTLAGDAMDGVDQKTVVCGQCHNSLGNYRLKASGDETELTDYTPYRNGHSADALYQTFLEDDYRVTYEEETGATLVSVGHPDMELFIDSTHQSLGLNCTDCHMAATTNENGEAFTDHNASGSPLENPEAMEFCQTCHQDQGIDSAEAMVAYVKEVQEEFAASKAAVDEKIATLKDELVEATAQGGVDEEQLQTARSNYSLAKFYLTYAVGGGTEAGSKIAHNPDEMKSLVSRADALIDDALGLLK